VLHKHFILNYNPMRVPLVPLCRRLRQHRPPVFFPARIIKVILRVAYIDQGNTATDLTFGAVFIVYNIILLTTPKLLPIPNVLELDIIEDYHVDRLIPFVKRPLTLKISVAKSGEV